MKTIYLVRHAKSDWGNENLKDIDRPLNQRGYNDVYLQSKKFAQEQLHPELIISSPAVRAYSTCAIFTRELKRSEEEIKIAPELFEAHSEGILTVIASINNTYNSIMLFGHNPGFTDVFNEISDSFADELPTCAIVGIKVNVIDWSEIFSTKGKAFLTCFPKDFKQ